MVTKTTKTEIYSRGQIGTPIVGEADVERIKEIRGQRFRQEEIRRLQRKAEPIKKRNVSQLQSEISKQRNEIPKIKERIQKYERRINREKDEEDTDKERIQRYENRIDRYEAEIEGTEKALKELEKAEQQYKEFDFEKVLANEKFANKVKKYADDIKDAEVDRERRKIRFREAKEKNEEKLKKLTSGELSPEEYSKEYAKLPDILQEGLLAPGGSGGYGAKYERAMEQAKLSPEEKEKVSAWMDRYQMSPTPEKIREILDKPKVKPEKRVAYKNILTGEITFDEQKPEQRSEIVRPVYIDPQGKELPAREQGMLKLERPELFKEPKLEQASTLQKLSTQISTEGFFTTLFKKTQEGRQFLAEELTDANREATKDYIKTAQEKLRTEGDKLSESQKEGIREGLKDAREKMERYERAERSGVPTPESQLAVLGGEIIADIAIPAVGIADLAILAGYGAETIYKAEKPRVQQFIKDVKGGNLTTQDIQDIQKSMTVPVGFRMTKPLAKKISNDIKKKGLVDGLKDNAEPLWNNVVEFYTKADAVDKLKGQEKTLLKEKKEFVAEQKKDKIYEEESYRRAVRRYDKSIQEVRDAIKNVKEQATVTQAGTVMILTGIGAAAGIAASRRAARNLALANYDDAVQRYNSLKKIAKKDVSLQYSQGVQQVDSYTGNFGRIKNIDNFAKYIDNFDDIKRIDVAKSSNAYVQRTPIFKKINLPDSLKKAKKTGTTSYLTYLPDVPNDLLRTKTVSQINSIPGYNVYYKNAVTFNIVDKAGKSKAISFLARSNKPLPNFRNPFNAIKYGAGKKLVLSKNIGDDIILSQINRLRAGEAIPEGSILARGRTTVETRTPTRARARSPEEFWGLSAPRGKTAVKRVKEGERGATILSPENYFFGSQRRTISRTRTVTDPITIDLGNVRLALSDSLETLRRAKRTKTIKLTSSQKALDDLNKAITKASRSGKRTITLKPETVNKLSRTDLNKVTSAISTIDVGTPRIPKLPKNIDTGIKTTSKELKSVASNINKISSRIDNTISKIESKRFLTRLNPSDKATFKKQAEKIKQDINSNIKQADKTISKLKNLISNIQRQRGKISTAEITAQVNTQGQKISQLQSMKRDLRMRLRQISITQRNILQTQVSTPRSPTRTTPTPSPTTTRLPRVGFPSPGTTKRKRDDGTLVSAFQTEVRRKGQWIPVGRPTYKQRAKKRGVRETGKTLAQSFRVRKTSRKLPKSERKEFASLGKYYKKKSPKGNIWIEKPKAKIDSPQEKRALKRARKKKPKKRTRRKSADSYWFGSRR